MHHLHFLRFKMLQVLLSGSHPYGLKQWILASQEKRNQQWQYVWQEEDRSGKTKLTCNRVWPSRMLLQDESSNLIGMVEMKGNSDIGTAQSNQKYTFFFFFGSVGVSCIWVNRANIAAAISCSWYVNSYFRLFSSHLPFEEGNKRDLRRWNNSKQKVMETPHSHPHPHPQPVSFFVCVVTCEREAPNWELWGEVGMSWPN